MRSPGSGRLRVLGAFVATLFVADFYGVCVDYVSISLVRSGRMPRWMTEGVNVGLPSAAGSYTPTFLRPIRVVATTPIILCAMFAYAVFTRRKEDPYNRCLQCGYILRGLVEPRCPECNTPFEPTRSPPVKADET